MLYVDGLEKLTRSVTQPSRFSMTATENSRPYLCMRISRRTCSSTDDRREDVVHRRCLRVAWTGKELTFQFRPRCSIYDADECATKEIRRIQTTVYFFAYEQTPSNTAGSGSRVLLDHKLRSKAKNARLTPFDQEHQNGLAIAHNRVQAVQAVLRVYLR